MAILLRAIGATVNATAPVNVAKPAGILAGDMLLMQVNTGSTVDVNVPAGWTLAPNTVQTATSKRIRIFYKIATASEPDTYALSASGATAIGAKIIAWYSDSGAAIEIDASGGQGNVSSTTVTWPSITTTRPDTVLNCFANFDSNIAATPQAGMAERWDENGSSRLYLMTQTVAASGATGTRTATAGGAVVSRCAAVAIGEVETAPDPLVAPTGLTATAISESQIDLAWNDTNAVVDGWSIERSPDGTTGWLEIATSAIKSYSNTGLAAGTAYYYRVRAYRN